MPLALKKPSKPGLKSASKPAKPTRSVHQHGVQASTLPPCEYPPVPVGSGLFRLADGKSPHDRSGAVNDRIQRMIDYRRWAMSRGLVHMILSRRDIEDMLMSWGADPARAEHVITQSEINLSVDGEDDDLPPDLP